MYRHFRENCCCIEYYRTILCCHFQPEFCRIIYCPCQAICCQTFRILPQTYRKFSTMPPKLNSSSDPSTKKKSTKLKKRNVKSKRDGKNIMESKDFVLDKMSLEDSKASNSISSVEYFRDSFNNGNNIRLTHSESVVGSRASFHSNSGIRNSDSYCNYQCRCKPMKGCQGKPEMNFNLLTHNGMPIKQTHQVRGPNYSMHRTNKKGNEFYYNNLENIISPVNSERPSYESRNSYQSEASINRRPSYDSPSSYTSQIKPNTSKKSNCYACVKCEHSNSITNACAPKSSTQKHSCQCNCSLCRKASPTRTSSLRSVRQSFSSSKSCPQLDIIKEEEPENEDYTNATSLERSNLREVPTKSEAQSKPVSSGPLKTQKSLEDSCADFLNIVCDNILESVQKSIEKKLLEYSNNVEEKFKILGRKVDKSESAVKDFSWEIFQKMTEQNKNNFEKISALVQNLVENRTANQYAMTRNNCQDKECQWEPLLGDENRRIMEIVDGEADGAKNISNEDGGMKINTSYVAESASTKEENIRKKKHTNGFFNKWCNCCHCNDSILTQPSELDKSYSSKTVTEPPSYLHEGNVSLPKAHMDKRSAGGCTYCGSYKKENIQVVGVPINHSSTEAILSNSTFVLGDLQTRGLPTKEVTRPGISPINYNNLNKEDNLTTMEQPLKFPASQLNSPRTSETLTMQQESDTSQRDLSLPKYTTFCLTPPGKTIFNCNCSSTGCDNTENINTSVCKTTNDTNVELKPVCRNLYDNYDTSGYATEPEDNNDTAACNSARKKLQKKASKQHCSSQTLEMGHSAGGYDHCNEKRGSHIGKRSSKTNSIKTSNPSPTRLSRL